MNPSSSGSGSGFFTSFLGSSFFAAFLSSFFSSCLAGCVDCVVAPLALTPTVEANLVNPSAINYEFIYKYNHYYLFWFFSFYSCYNKLYNTIIWFNSC